MYRLEVHFGLETFSVSALLKITKAKNAGPQWRLLWPSITAGAQGNVEVVQGLKHFPGHSGELLAKW